LHQYLAITVILNPCDNQESFGNVSRTIPDFEVACIYKEIRNRMFDRSLEEFFNLFIQLFSDPGGT
jgi:hypothetical protein